MWSSYYVVSRATYRQNMQNYDASWDCSLQGKQPKSLHGRNNPQGVVWTACSIPPSARKDS